RLKRELENLEREDSDNLEKQLDDLALGLDEMNSSKPFKVINEDGILKLKVNKDINERILELINEAIENFLVIEDLKVFLDLTDVDFEVPELERDFEKIINKIKVMDGEVEVIS
ncbi:MAG: hypothetical protein ACQERJ_00055, partial [Bacillota bacterium]